MSEKNHRVYVRFALADPCCMQSSESVYWNQTHADTAKQFVADYLLVQKCNAKFDENNLRTYRVETRLHDTTTWFRHEVRIGLQATCKTFRG